MSYPQYHLITQSCKVVDGEIDIPSNILETVDKDLELAINVVYTNKQTYLAPIYQSVTFKATVLITTRDDDDIYEALYVVLQHYNDAGCNILRIHEYGKFQSLLDRAIVV